MKVRILSQDKEQYMHDMSEVQIIAFTKYCLKEFKIRLKRIIPDVGIIFVSKTAIQKLNMKYRMIDKPTDVLSFNSEEDGYLGDIIIAKNVVEEYAKMFHCSYEEELQRDILHGIMHLLGYDHVDSLQEGSKEEMFSIQEEILHNYSK